MELQIAEVVCIENVIAIEGGTKGKNWPIIGGQLGIPPAFLKISQFFRNNITIRRAIFVAVVGEERW